MKIIRNGIEIELTPEELRHAYDEYERICHAEDVKFFLGQFGENISDELIDNIVTDWLDMIADNDYIAESHWDTLEYVLKEHNISYDRGI